MSDTKNKLLDAAEKLTQTKGFNGFSYIDLSEIVGVKTSSIHYHFKSKADLAQALVERIYDGHTAACSDMSSRIAKPEKRLSALVSVFEDYAANDKFCLCGMLSAELQSISPAVRKKLRAYFEHLTSWVAEQFKEMGIKDSNNRALSFMSALEGSLLIARLNGDVNVIRDAMKLFKKA